MTRATQMRRDALRRYFIFRIKLIELFHFHRLFAALADDEFVPENVMGHGGREFADSVRTALLSWFCTIVDRSRGGLNIFAVWLELFPNQQDEIERVKREVEPHWEILRTYRDKCGFHADTPRNYFLAKQKVLDNAQEVINALQDFLGLAKRLIDLQEAELPDFVPEVENFLLDFELEEGNRGIRRDTLKKLLILPRTKYKRVFG